MRLSWIRGLERLGCEVWFVEQIAEQHCTDEYGHNVPFSCSSNNLWWSLVGDRFGLAQRSSLMCDSGETIGASIDQIRQIATDGALLVNISGHLTEPTLLSAFRRRVYVDIDPGFTQFWDANGNAGARLQGHDRFVTIGEHIGRPGCDVPTGDRQWHHVRQPVVLDDWPVQHRAEPGTAGLGTADRFRFTTIATWRGPFGPIERDRRRFGLKLHEFRKFIALPTMVDARFEVALAIHPDESSDLDLLDRSGWELVDPTSAAGSPDSFRSYVTGSMAEFSVAQGMYVESNCGWFSDRTTRYLASGRPALVQDTGFSSCLPTGSGLVAFTTLDEARAGAASILADHDAHCRSARAIAETYFDSDVVLARFLDRCDLP